MKLIVGLGNPEKKYEKTRHNTGFMVLDQLASDWQDKSKFHGQISESDNNGEKVVYYKPSTYYNDSGIGVRAIVEFYNVPLENILIIHDDLSLPFGTIRTRVGKPDTDDAGNNGIKSIDIHLKTKEYARLRIGIGQEDRHQNDADFVLGGFNQSESQKLSEIFKIADDIVRDFLQGSFEHTSHK